MFTRRWCLTGVIGVATALGAAPVARAQTFASDDPALARIWRLGMDSSRVQWLATRLLDSLGPRLTGTPGMDRAQDWVVAMMRSWGIEARKERYGTWRGWRRGTSHIDLVAPRVRTLEGTMLGWSPGTGGRPVEVEPIILPRFADSAAFVRWLPNARGKYVLISGPQESCRPSGEWETWATPASAARMAALRDSIRFEWGGASVRGTQYSAGLGGGALGRRLEAGGAAGVISYRYKDARGVMEVFDTQNATAPTIALSCEDYGLVFRLTENGMGPRLRVTLDAEALGEVPVTNAIGTIRGTTRPNEYVMLSAHFDSWDGSSGATDNGTGSLTMLEAMRILRQVLPNPQRTILVGFWSGEEQGLIGSRAYVEDNPAIVSAMQALFNQDNGTGRIRSLSAAGWPMAANKLLSWYDRLPREFQEQAPFYGGGGGLTTGRGGGGSDNASFACYGAPTFGLGATSWDYNSFTWHTDRDTYDKVVFDDLKANATLTAMLAYMASEDPDFIRRDTSVVVVTRPMPEGALAGRGGGRGGAGRGGDAAAAGRGGGRGGDAAAAAGRGGGRGAGAGGRGGPVGLGDPSTCPRAARSAPQYR